LKRIKIEFVYIIKKAITWICGLDLYWSLKTIKKIIDIKKRFKYRICIYKKYKKINVNKHLTFFFRYTHFVFLFEIKRKKLLIFYSALTYPKTKIQIHIRLILLTKHKIIRFKYSN
jgi:nicotinic acid mononucleotide adenylyltransferase